MATTVRKVVELLKRASDQKWSEDQVLASLSEVVGPPKAKEEEFNLTPKQEKFCQVYLETGNASEAYRQAYNASRMSEGCINVKACALLKQGKVRDRVGYLRNKTAQKHEVTRDWLIQQLRNMAGSDFGDYAEYGPNGVVIKSSKELTPNQRACVSEVSETVGNSGRTLRFKLEPKLPAIEQLCRIFGMFNDKIQIGVGIGDVVSSLESAVSPDFAESVRRALAEVVRSKGSGTLPQGS